MATSSEQLEREAEQSRARLSAKLDGLRAQITPGQIVDQLTDYARETGGAELLRNLGRQVRDNPLPLTVMGAAFAWLLMGQRAVDGSGTRIGRPVENLSGRAKGLRAKFQSTGRDFIGSTQGAAEGIGDAFRDHLTGVQNRTQSTAERISEAAGSAGSRVAAAGRRAQERLSDLTDRASSAAASAADRASSAYQRTAEYTSDMGQAAGEMGRTMTDKAASIAQSTTAASRSFAEFCAEQPLVIAGIGIAVGAAIGAALPGTTAKNRVMGDTADELKRKGEELASQTWEQAKTVAQAGYEAAKNEAEKQTAPERAEDPLVRPGG
jgi:hypothetical protein